MTKEQLFNRLIDQLTGSSAFFGHAVIDEQDEAMMVMMHVLQEDVEQILSTGEALLSDAQVKRCHELVNERLFTLKPMAYIVGEVSFAGLNFYCDERALVPRSPLAEIIVDGFSSWFADRTIKNALDLCTGGGCIGLALAHHCPQAHVDVSDISVKALSLAMKNCERHGLVDRVNIVHSDLFAEIDQRYDVIVSNPPYVSDVEYQELPKEYKHEPKKGLVTEMDGLRIPVEILSQAAGHLNEDGYVFLEVGYTDELLENAFPSIAFEWVDFLHGGQGVCVFSQKKLLEYQALFESYLTQMNNTENVIQ